MDLRASDAERERVASFLRDRCLEGRLDPDELDERIAAALRARTRGALAELVADLPGGAAALPVDVTPVPVPSRTAIPPRRAVVPVLAVLAGLVLACALVATKEVLLLVGLASIAFALLGVILVVTLGPWLAAGAGAVWLVRRVQGRRRPVGPGSARTIEGPGR